MNDIGLDILNAQSSIVEARTSEGIEECLMSGISPAVIAAVLVSNVFALRSSASEAQGSSKGIMLDNLRQDVTGIDLVLTQATIKFAQLRGFDIRGEN
jgi:hypothetical protein